MIPTVKVCVVSAQQPMEPTEETREIEGVLMDAGVTVLQTGDDLRASLEQADFIVCRWLPFIQPIDENLLPFAAKTTLVYSSDIRPGAAHALRERGLLSYVYWPGVGASRLEALHGLGGAFCAILMRAGKEYLAEIKPIAEMFDVD